MSAPVSTVHKVSFIGLVAFTVASPMIAGFVAYHSDRRLGAMCFSAMLALLVWSSLLFRRARVFGIIGFVALAMTFWLLIMVPGFVAGKRALQPTTANQPDAAPELR